VNAIAEPDLPSALVLGRYRLLERLGEGGFGVVWRARDELLHREVALKRIPQSGPGDARRASREALAAARLSHPAIVSLYEACAEGDAFYLISELVHGETLAELIARDAVDDRLALEIGVELSEALAHAHARGVIHRDVKPHNVLVPAPPPAGRRREGAVAKLTDFGGARLAGEQALTRTGDVLGTLAYMAPEQSEGQAADERADLYSLALVLYECLSGVNPVRGANPAETARRVGRPLAPLEELRGDLPPELTDALDTAVSPHPEDRGTFAELRQALLDALAAPALAPATRSPRPAPGWRPAPPPRATGPSRGRAIDRDHDDAALAGDRFAGADGAGDGFADAEHARDRFAAAGGERDRFAPVVTLEDDGGEQGLRPESRPWAAPGLGERTQRMIWRAAAAVLVGWQAIAGRFGVALLLAAALAPVLVLRRPGRSPLAGLLAPVLGLAALAGAFPAFAAQARRWPRRAFLGALGFWWLLLAEPLLERRLWWGPPGAARAVGQAAWERSPTLAAAHVLDPLVSLATLAGVLLWAAAAAVEPWFVRGRSLLRDLFFAGAWAAALTLAAERLHRALAHGATGWPRGALLGALAAVAVALCARALRGPAGPL
jgi:hypothetical protein